MSSKSGMRPNHQVTHASPDAQVVSPPSHRETQGASKSPLKAREYLLGHRIGREIIQGARQEQEDQRQRLIQRKKAPIFNGGLQNHQGQNQVEVKQINLFDPGLKAVMPQLLSARQDSPIKGGGQYGSVKVGGKPSSQLGIRNTKRVTSGKKSQLSTNVRTKYETSVEQNKEGASDGFTLNLQDPSFIGFGSPTPSHAQGVIFNQKPELSCPSQDQLVQPYDHQHQRLFNQVFYDQHSADQALNYWQNNSGDPLTNKSSQQVYLKTVDQSLQEETVNSNEEHTDNQHVEKKAHNIQEMLNKAQLNNRGGPIMLNDSDRSKPLEVQPTVNLAGKRDQYIKRQSAAEISIHSSIESDDNSEELRKRRHTPDMKINLRSSTKRDEERGRSLKKCIQGLNLLSPKCKLELDYRTINNDSVERHQGESPDPFKTGHFNMERCPSEMNVWSARKAYVQGKRYQTPKATDGNQYATIFEKFQSNRDTDGLRHFVDEQFKGSFQTLVTNQNYSELGFYSPVRKNQALEDYIQENLKKYQGILTKPVDAYRTNFSTFKTLYTRRYKTKRELVAIEKEISNISQVNLYIEDKLHAEKTQEVRLEEEILSLQGLLEAKLSQVKAFQLKSSQTLATLESQKLKQMNNVNIMQQGNQNQMQNHMTFILHQKDEILAKKANLDRARNECDSVKQMRKRMARAEEDRMMDVMHTNSKICK